MALTKSLGGGSGSALTVKDEGVTLSTAVTSIDVVGAGGTATNVGGAVTLTIPGGTASEVLITETVVSVAQATIPFTSIVNTYRDLRVVVRGRGTNGTSFVRPRLQFNSDTGTNYEWERHTGHTTTVEAEGGGTPGGTGATFIDIGTIPGSTATSGRAGAAECRIFNYRGTTYWKETLSHNGGTVATERYVMTGCGIWRSTSAITSVTIILDAGNFDVDTVGSLYGIL